MVGASFISMQGYDMGDRNPLNLDLNLDTMINDGDVGTGLVVFNGNLECNEHDFDHNVGTYTMTSRSCKVCPDFGFICRGGNNVTINTNWFVIKEYIDFDTANGTTSQRGGRLAKQICPNGY